MEQTGEEIKKAFLKIFPTAEQRVIQLQQKIEEVKECISKIDLDLKKKASERDVEAIEVGKRFIAVNDEDETVVALLKQARNELYQALSIKDELIRVTEEDGFSPKFESVQGSFDNHLSQASIHMQAAIIEGPRLKAADKYVHNGNVGREKNAQQVFARNCRLVKEALAIRDELIAKARSEGKERYKVSNKEIYHILIDRKLDEGVSDTNFYNIMSVLAPKNRKKCVDKS